MDRITKFEDGAGWFLEWAPQPQDMWIRHPKHGHAATVKKSGRFETHRGEYSIPAHVIAEAMRLQPATKQLVEQKAPRVELPKRKPVVNPPPKSTLAPKSPVSRTNG